MPSGSKKKKASKKKKHHNNKRINHNSQEGNAGKDDDVISQDDDVISQDEKEATTSIASGGNLSDSAEKRMEGAAENGNRKVGSVEDAASVCESKEVSIEHLRAVKGSDGGESYGDDASSGSSSSSDDERRNVEITSGAPVLSTEAGVVQKDVLITEASEVSAVEWALPLSEVPSESVQAAAVERVVPSLEAASEPEQAAAVAVDRVVLVSDEVAVETAAAGKLEAGEVKEAETVQNIPSSDVAESVPVEKSEVVQVDESTSVENSEVVQFPATEPKPVEISGSSGVVVSPRTDGNDNIALPPSELNPIQKARDGGEVLKETERKEQHVLPVVRSVNRTSWLSCCGLLDVFRRSN